MFAICTLEKGEGRADTMHSPMTVSQRPTQSNKWHRVFGELGALPKIREENVSELQMVFEFFRWFSNFSVLCECCWWKLLVRCKTLIYCGQLCNNAVNYPSIAYPFNVRGRGSLTKHYVQFEFTFHRSMHLDINCSYVDPNYVNCIAINAGRTLCNWLVAGLQLDQLQVNRKPVARESQASCKGIASGPSCD
jgi:hypothetical protein